jgi:acetate kinase
MDGLDSQSKPKRKKEDDVDKVETLKNIEIFKDISEESLQALADKAEFKNYAAGESIIRFGVKGKALSILVSGKAEVSWPTPEGKRERLRVLEKESFFGEMSLMTGEPTTAEVAALEPAQVLMIPHEAIYPVIAGEPTLMAKLARTISKRLVDLERSKAAQDRIVEARRAQEDPYELRKFPLSGGGKILTINCGSSSVKYRLFDSRDQYGGCKGLVEKIGLSGTKHIFERGGEEREETVDGDGYAAAFKAMVRALGGEEGVKTIDCVGHRVVHGGMDYAEAILINEEILENIRKCEKLAPLHIPANVAGIEEAMLLMPDIPQVAVFDTGFHKTIPRHAQIYGLPYRFYGEEGVRRYGFHGMSHKFVALQAATFLKRPFNELKVITCHLGNGASLAAVDHGRCTDTTMGMTPLEGLIMGTRSGDLDPGALLHIMKEHELTPSEMERILMKESGLVGLSGVSSDMREVLLAASGGEDQALLAVQSFCYRIKKYIGAYWAALGGLDALVFTGGIGENSPEIRARVCQGLSAIGVLIDDEANHEPGIGDRSATLISNEESLVKVLVIPTDEERMIARETARALSRHQVTNIMKTQRDKSIPIGVSAHHVHLSSEHVEALFGEGHELIFRSPLSQPGQFACEEQVTLVGPKGRIERVRVLGPARKATQAEISRTEEFKLGIDAPIRQSGYIKGTPGMTIIGSNGSVTLEEGVICAQRHIHMTPEDALFFGLRDKDVIMVESEGERSLIFGDVVVRVDPNFKLEFHLDTDEANAAELNTGMKTQLHSIQSRQ